MSLYSMKRSSSSLTMEEQRFNSAGFYAKLMGATTTTNHISHHHHNRKLHGFPCVEDDLLSSVIPQVTVVLEGRSICQRISLHKHSSYHSLAKALRQMFVDVGDVRTGGGDGGGEAASLEHELDLSNAIPGHLIAYEDMEDDLLLVGDLNWKDFVRVAKRIRIIPVKANPRRRRQGA